MHCASVTLDAARRMATVVFCALAVGVGCSGKSSVSPTPTPPPRDDYPDITIPYPNHHESASWSVGEMIVYEDRGVAPGREGIWIIDAQTKAEARLTTQGATPTWSPDGTAVAFSNGPIHVMDVATMQTRRVSQGSGFYPSWSADGERICYQTYSGGVITGVAIVSAEGEHINHLEGAARTPAWCPDARILHTRFVPGDPGTFQVFSMDSSGGTVVQLTTSSGVLRWPSSALDGKHIAFSAHLPGTPLPQIWVADASGQNPRQLTTHGGCDPSWSPDGSRIVYTRCDWYRDASDAGVLWIIDVDSGSEEQLTTKVNLP